MKKYVFLIAGLTAASALANDRDAGAIGGRLGDGAYMKATGMSAVEWASRCGRKESADMTYPHRVYSYSETQRLMPDQTPISTETIQGESATLDSSATTQAGISAGSRRDANYSATVDDATPVPQDSLSDNHSVAVGSSANFSSDKNVSTSNQPDHSSIYADKSDFSASGTPATTERGVGSSSSELTSPTLNTPPSPPVEINSEAAWSSQIKSDLTRETPENTGLSTFTSANLQNVQISRANGTVMLRGTVPSERMKRDIETRVRELSAGAPINNQLSVAPSADLPANGSSVPRD